VEAVHALIVSAADEALLAALAGDHRGEELPALQVRARHVTSRPP